MVRCPIGKDVIIIGLELWAQFNRNLDNKGLSGNKYTSENPPTFTDGKIGKCLKNGSIEYSLDCQSSNDFSFSFWMKWVDLTNDTLYFTIPIYNNDTVDILHFIKVTYTDNIAIKICTPTNTPQMIWMYSTTWGENQWVHFCVNVASLDNGINVKVYMNGKSTGWEYSSSSYKFQLRGNGGININTNNVLLNDVRLYSHALSPKEIKLISQALVLHYPMGTIDGKIAGRNLLLNSDFRNGKENWYVCENIKNDGTYNYVTLPNTLWKVAQKVQIEENQNYIFSCFAKKTNSNLGNPSLSFKFDNLNNLESNTVYVDKTIWTKYTFTITAKVSGNDNFYIINRNNIEVDIRNLKLEKGTLSITPWTPAPEDVPQWYNNIIYDTSGYMNNGTVTDAATPMWDSDSPRYSGSYSFDGKNIRYINTVSLNTTGFKDTWTISWWSKTSDMNDRMAWGLNTNNLNFYPVGGVFYLNTGDGASNPFQKDGVSVTYASYLGAWHHYIVTGDGTQNLLYIDGKSVGKAVAYRPIAGNTLRIGTWPYDTGHLWNGNISDFRIYATALSSSDIEYLYKTSASVTKNGTLLLAGEVVE